MKGQCEVTWQNRRAYKYWRYVLVDHSGNKAWYSGIGWFVLTKDVTKPENSSRMTARINL